MHIALHQPVVVHDGAPAPPAGGGRPAPGAPAHFPHQGGPPLGRGDLGPHPRAFPPLRRRALSRRWYPGRGSIPVFRDDSRQKSSRTPRSNAWRVAGLADAPLKQSAGGEPIEKLAVPRTGHGDEASDRCASTIADGDGRPARHRAKIRTQPRAKLADTDHLVGAHVVTESSGCDHVNARRNASARRIMSRSPWVVSSSVTRAISTHCASPASLPATTSMESGYAR